MGGKLSFWAAGYFGVEDLLDGFWGNKDFTSSVGAGLVMSAAFSRWSKCIYYDLLRRLWSLHLLWRSSLLTSVFTDGFDMITTVNMAKRGLTFGLAFGLAQDTIGYLRGRPLGYVDWIRGRRRDHADLA